ncbi:MAG: hypothetical protein MHPSP_001032, partial [Paramarteilia canceri]
NENWKLIGKFNMENRREIQSFSLKLDIPVLYIKIESGETFGTENVAVISDLKIFAHSPPVGKENNQNTHDNNDTTGNTNGEKQTIKQFYPIINNTDHSIINGLETTANKLFEISQYMATMKQESIETDKVIENIKEELNNHRNLIKNHSETILNVQSKYNNLTTKIEFIEKKIRILEVLFVISILLIIYLLRSLKSANKIEKKVSDELTAIEQKLKKFQLSSMENEAKRLKFQE